MAISFEAKLLEMVKARAEREQIEREQQAAVRAKAEERQSLLDAKARELCAEVNSFIGPKVISSATAYGGRMEVFNQAKQEMRVTVLDNDLYRMEFPRTDFTSVKRADVEGDENTMMEEVIKWLRPDAKI